MENVDLVRSFAKEYPGLELLLLFGSHARKDASEHSDWDFGFIAHSGFQFDAFYSELVLLLKTESIDLVDLTKANGLLRFRAAKDGKVIFEKNKAYEKFWLEAVHFWCDAGSLIRSEYNAILKGIQHGSR